MPSSSVLGGSHPRLELQEKPLGTCRNKGGLLYRIEIVGTTVLRDV